MSGPTAPLVVVPTYCEAENIGRLLARILELPSGFHALVVDDSSPDGTTDIVRKMRLGNRERLHLLVRAKKEGLGRAYMEGFRWALENGYPFVCEMDADFSHDPADLERLMAAARNADLVLATRYARGGATVGWPLRRRFLSRSANLFARLALGTKLTDLTGGFKCYRREALQALDLSAVRSGGYAFQIETTFRALRLGLKVTEIPITFRERARGRSKIASFRTSRETFLLVVRLGLSRFRPTRA